MSSNLKKIVPKTAIANKCIQYRRIIRAPAQDEEKLRDHFQAEIVCKTKACSNKVIFYAFPKNQDRFSIQFSLNKSFYFGRHFLF